MGKWLETEQQMKPKIRDEIISALWSQIAQKENLTDDERIQKFFVIKVVLGLMQDINQQYVPTENAQRIDNAIRNKDFSEFKKAFDNISYEQLADIQMHEKLSLKPVQNFSPKIDHEDIQNLQEYMRDKGISACVSITNSGQTYNVSSDNIQSANSTFAMHSIGKVFTGVLAVKMIHDGIIDEKLLDKPVQLDEHVLKALPTQVQEQLKSVTLKQLMLHEGGLGDYLPKQAIEVEKALNSEVPPPKVDSSNDLLKYADEDVSPKGNFRYSNLGILLVGFALEKQYNDYHKLEGDKRIGIDKIIEEFAKNDIKMDVFETHMPRNGIYSKDQRFEVQNIPRDDEYMYQFIASRFGSPAGGYCSTTSDLAKFGSWIQQECIKSPEFERLIKEHGGEFYSANQQAVSHSGLHADSAHFYASLKDGTVITVMSDQGGLTSSTLVENILKQTTWLKNATSEVQAKAETPAPQAKSTGSRPPAFAPRFEMNSAGTKPDSTDSQQKKKEDIDHGKSNRHKP